GLVDDVYGQFAPTPEAAGAIQTAELHLVADQFIADHVLPAARPRLWSHLGAAPRAAQQQELVLGRGVAAQLVQVLTSLIPVVRCRRSAQPYADAERLRTEGALIP